jgi:Na+-driven multidrug efflux pump
LNAHPFARDGLWGILRRMALPGVAGAVLMSVHTLVDAAFVGKFLGPDALAGLSLGMPLAVLSGAFTGWIGGGAATVWSRALGRGEEGERPAILAQVFWLSLAASLLLGVPGFLLAESFLRIMGGSGNNLAAGAEFYRIFLAGSFFSLFGVSANGLLRAEGKISLAMRFAFLSVFLNIALDACFLVFLGWGIGAAAWSTLLSTAVLALAVTRYSPAARTDARSRRERLFPPGGWRLGHEILANGFPSLVTQSTIFLRQALLFQAAAHWGDGKDIAFLGAAFRIFTFAVMPVFGLMQSLQPVAGINHGAGRGDRSIQAVWIWSSAGVLLLLPVWCVLQAFPGFFLSFFFPPAEVPLEQVGLFRLAMLGLPLLVFPVAVMTALQAMGKYWLATGLSVGRQVFLFPVLLFGLAGLSGLRGIYQALVAESVLFAVVTLAVFLSIRRGYIREAEVVLSMDLERAARS